MRLAIKLLFITFFGIHGLQAQLIDSENSKVSFEISNLGFNTVEGNFSGLKGELNLSKEQGASRLSICLNPATISTGIDKRDEHLKEEDFFWTSKYPEICFKGRKFKFLGEGRWEVEGILSIRDVSKPITIVLTKKGKMATCDFSIKRKDYNVGNDFSSFTAGEEVKLMVSLSLK
ncbi:MAG: YceI family protein [Croceimicrobium sp.]